MTIMAFIILIAGTTFGLRADINHDGRVDLLDFAIMAEEWLMSEHLGPNLVTNGDFSDGDTGWTKSGQVDVFGGAAAFTVGAPAGVISQPIAITAGCSYRVTYTVADYTGGSITPNLGTTAGTPRTQNGTFTETILAAGDATVTLSGSVESSLTVDDISVYEIYYNNLIADLSTAVMTRYNATPAGDALRSELTGGLWFSQAKPDVSFPYAVFTWDGSNIEEICGGTTQLTMQDKRIETVSITVEIFSKNDDGGAEVFGIADRFLTHFDWCTLSLSGYSFLSFKRNSIVNHGKVDNIWTIEIDYEAMLSH